MSEVRFSRLFLTMFFEQVCNYCNLKDISRMCSGVQIDKNFMDLYVSIVLANALLFAEGSHEDRRLHGHEHKQSKNNQTILLPRMQPKWSSEFV